MDIQRRTVDCHRCPLQACKGLRSLDPHQLDFMNTFKEGEIALQRGGMVLEQERRSVHLYTLLEGVLIRYRELEDGRRQIVNFMFPGDMVGLQGAFDDAIAHSVEALADARLCIFSRDRFPSLLGEHPRLGYDLIWLAAKEETALEQHIVSLGRRSARERVTFLAVWLLDRAIGSGIVAEGNELRIAVTQVQIADMLGLSQVHTNRTIKSLAHEGLVEWKPGHLRVPDMRRAADEAQYEVRANSCRPFL